MVYLTPQNTRERKTVAIMEELRQKTATIPGLVKQEYQLIEFGPPAGRPVEVQIRGAEFEKLSEISWEIRQYMAGLDGVYDIQDDLEKGKKELRVKVNEEDAARLGLTVDGISRTVFAAYQGIEATIIREAGEEVVVRVRLAEKFRQDEQALSRLLVPAANGRMIPLSRAATIEIVPGTPTITHFDGDRVVTVSASIDTDKVKSTEVNRKVIEKFSDIPVRHPGYDLLLSGEWKETQKLVTFMYKAAGIAMLLIYGILVVQFGSFLQPVVVMFSIPLGMIGVVIALILHGKPVSLMAMMGMIGLAGVVVNDAIVLVSFINDERRNKGKPMFDAIVEAGVRRLRPIMLTSVTTIAGMLPVIYGIGGYEPFVAPAAIAIAYGLLFATVLTLLVVPVVYFISAEMKAHVRAVMSGVGSKMSSLIGKK